MSAFNVSVLLSKFCGVTNCPESKDDLHYDSADGSSEFATATSSSRPVEFHTTPNQPNISFKRDVNNRSYIQKKVEFAHLLSG